MNRQDALRQVASTTASNLFASTFEEATGVMNTSELTEADARRLSWAVGEVLRRLDRMGTRNR